MIDKDGQVSLSHIVPVGLKTLPISISPNPASDWINISGVTKKGTVNIANTAGIRVISTTINPGSTSINIVKFPGGIYVLRYTNGSESIVKKLLVQG